MTEIKSPRNRKKLTSTRSYLIIELQKVWNIKEVVIQVVIGALGENR